MKIILKKHYIFILLCALIGLTFIYSLFIMNELHTNIKPDENLQKEYEKLKLLVDKLEIKAKENAETLDNLGKFYKDFVNAKNHNGHNDRINDVVVVTKAEARKTIKIEVNNEKSVAISDQCEWIRQKPTKTDVNMLSVYDELPFDDIDGGVWKQGWDIKYDAAQWSSNNKLNVIVIPHSHNDPGWLMTFEEYFNSKTKGILNTIVNALSEKTTRKFVWAETSYLSLWWNQADDTMKEKMKKLISNGQLEIVTGGWVMNDEANTHYYSMIEQMIEGHEWLRANVDENLKPKNGWSIDPFGYSPTMAYLLKQFGFDNMLIQRVHYRIKKYLAQNKNLEFYWSQLWDRSDDSKNSKIFTHVMPFYSYDVPHTCGPDPSICCQFDFRRMIDYSMSCPWGKQPVEINNGNVEERAFMLLDQYRKKNQLYNHNVVLIPLGDDFRYTSEEEANAQYRNYEKLMEYINTRPDWNANVKFGTLKDYFDLVHQQKPLEKDIPVLNGDFFTYADRNDHYWSGYYTSRPLYKRLDRTVEYYLRTAEILFSYAQIESLKNNKKNFNDDLYKQLITARRNLALFQHHDGITGTAKTFVNDDYGAKLLTSIQNSQWIIKKSIEFMLSSNSEISIDKFIVDDSRLVHDKLTSRNVINLKGDSSKYVYVFNSNEHKRIDIITVHVNTPFIELYDDKDQLMDDNYQLNLLWSKQQQEHLYLEPENDVYELLIQIEINPLEIKSFKIKEIKNIKNKEEYLEKYFTKNQYLTKTSPNPSQLNLVNQKLESNGINKNLLEVIKTNDYKFEVIELSASSKFKAIFDVKTGLLKKLVDTTSNEEYKANIRMVYYGVTNSREKSGAYLFLPDGPAKELSYDLNWIRVEKGPIRNRLCTNLAILTQCIELYPSKSTILNTEVPVISLWNLADIRTQQNFELAINIETDINNNDFYTDLNSYQFIRRKTYNKIPLQANVYPMPSGAYINDNKLRLTVLSAQTSGVNSLERSHLEVFLDRRLNQDDNRGLEQPVLDNKLTASRFLLVFEKVKNSDNNKNENVLQPNLNVLMNLYDLQHPLTTLVSSNNNNNNNYEEFKLPSKINLIDSNSQIPCGLRIINLRTMQTKDEKASNTVGLILHRVAHNCESELKYCSDNKNFNFQDLVTKSSLNDVKKTYLTFSNYPNDSESIKSTKSIIETISPMEIQAFRLEF